MLPFSVVLGSHCHVPEGLAEAEYEAAYNERLKPFLSALYRYPGIPAVLHYSGPLFYWVERKRPEFFDLIRKLLRRKQIEILSGGFHEPAMHLLAPQDRTGQVEMLSTYIRKHFGKRATGAWVPGACWEQSVVTSLSSCAISYTFLPEDHFAAAGVQTADLGLPVYTENQGALVMVFPVLPFGLEEAGAPLTVENLLALAGERGRHGVYTVFPERFQAPSPFSSFPSNESDNGSSQDNAAGIQAFLESCVASEHEINWTLPSRLYEEYTGEGKQSLQRLYFPCGGEKKFLTECSEANTIYAKMVFTRDLVRQLRGDRERKNAALHEVYKAQSCNLYISSARHNISDPALRKAAYRALLSAEKTVRETTKTVNSLYNFDFDFDGGTEEIFRSNNLCFYTHRKGGHVFGIDYLPVCWNYIDSFHNHSFIETLYSTTAFDSAGISGIEVREKLAETDRKHVRRCGEEWWEETAADRARQKLTFTLPQAPSGTACEYICIEKTYRLRQDTIIVSYTIHSRGTAEEQFLFCPEFHFAFAGYGEGQLRIFAQKDGDRVPVTAGDCYSNALDHIQFQDLDNETVITLSSDKRFDALLGINNLFGRYQSSSLTLIIPVFLERDAKISQEFCFSITH
jgi:alpha-amylase